MELREYIRPLRKWWWLILASTVIAVISSFLATRQQPPIYRTHATVMIGSTIENPNPNGTELWLQQQLANTYADIIQRDNVREATMAALGLEWLPEYSVRVVANTQLIEIAVTDEDPARAQAVANELANQMVKISPGNPASGDTQRQQFIDQQLTDLETQIQGTKTEITRRQTELGNLFSARQIADAQAQINGLQNKLTTLQANYAALLSNTQRGALNTITVIEPAAFPYWPVGPNRSATILLAAAIGLLLAAGAGYVLDYLDDTLKNPDDVERSVGMVTLGAVPRMERTSDSELVMLSSGQSAGKEAFRVLRTNLQFAEVDHPIKVLMVTSPAPSEGKSHTASNLAAAMAQAGRKVILVDTDLHKPRLHRVFGIRNNVGITTALLEERPDIGPLLQESPVPGLWLLTSGPLPPNPAELLGSARMRDLLSEMLAHADMVVLDSPPTVALADAAILSTQVDGVLLVVEAGKTRRDIAKRAAEALRRVNARLVGVVLNRMPTRNDGYYYYYYYSYNYSGYGDELQQESGRRKSNRRGFLGRRKPRRNEEQSGAPGIAPLPPGSGS
jgi:polysaccharide biosynthesis transport protein